MNSRLRIAIFSAVVLTLSTLNASAFAQRAISPTATTWAEDPADPLPLPPPPGPRFAVDF